MMKLLLLLLAVTLVASETPLEKANRKLNRAIDRYMDLKYANMQVPTMSDFKKCPIIPESKTKPTSVHCLKWSDVTAISALGDSLTAGVGARCNNILCLATEYRGVTWDIGGDNNEVTLVNFLKNYNPSLYGASTGRGTGNTRLNVGVSGAVSRDMPAQARALINKFNSDPNVQPDDWKVVNLFIGGNNLCRCCQTRNDPSDPNAPAAYAGHIEEALDLIQESLPNTFVNVMPIVDIVLLGEVSQSGGFCRTLLGSLCPCGISTKPEDIEYTYNAYKEYVKLTEELIAKPKYSASDNFAVVSQPFFVDTDLPRKPDGGADTTYFSPDCFHFSYKAHAAGAIALFNNMQEPVGSKTRVIDFNASPTCPDPEKNPYIATAKNNGGTFCPDDSKVAF